MENTPQPRIDLAEKNLPGPLFHALKHVFSQGIQGCMLVGGTALAGFYAAHRRSDDLDLFTRDEVSQKATVLAVKSLEKIGVHFLDYSAETAQYFRATCESQKHQFTVDVVLDSNIFKVGSAVTLAHNIAVADLQTLLKTKAATLVSRCSEKDLYDLIWLFKVVPNLNFLNLILFGQEVDSGVSAESILLSLSGATLSKESCGFSLTSKITKDQIYNEIIQFRKQMILTTKEYLENESAPLLKDLIRSIQKLQKNKRDHLL